jgi:NAD(P)-dependent dehydrogenase (short-subunit alcohol dehydrogenase family)
MKRESSKNSRHDETGAMVTTRFDGCTALVTGGTRGIGLQIAKDMHTAGARVVLTGTTPRSFELVRSHFDAGKYPAKFFPVDFTDAESTKNFLSNIDRLKNIDILVNNSGINRINPIDAIKTQDWNDLVAVNLSAPLLLIRSVARIMKMQRYGRIVNIGSVFGVISKAKRALYSITKHGLHGLTIATALDLAPYGILVNTVSPGFVLTELTKSILSAKEIKELTAQVPLGRFAEPEDISSVVLFLCSPENRYITSQNIIVDGGFVNV